MIRRLPWVLAWAAGPSLLFGAMIAAFLAAPAWPPPPAGVPPPGRLAVERVVLDDDGISLLVRAGAEGPVRVAQVQVDGAFWTFAQDPLGALPRLSAGWLRIPYPWVLGEAHLVTIVTARGAVFQHRIPLAAQTVARADLPRLAVLGTGLALLPLAFAGLVPPAAAGGSRGGDVGYAASVALLAVLLVGVARAALACAAEATSAYQGGAFVWLGGAATAVLLVATGWPARRASRSRAAALALSLSAHRFCQGLAVGAAVAVGYLALAAWLTLAFAFHGALAGVGYRQASAGGPRLLRWACVAALAASPLAGAWLGGQATGGGHRAALALAAGAGSILQVIAGAVRLALHRRRRARGGLAAGRGMLAAGLPLAFLAAGGMAG